MRSLVIALTALFVSSISALTFQIPRLPLSLAVSDIDLDGRIDLAIGHCNTGSDVNDNPAITLLRNFQNGAFASVDTSYTQPAYLETIKFAKLDEDDYPDIVIVSGKYINSIPHIYMSVFYNNGAYYEIASDYLLATTNSAYRCFTFADLNGDGLVDGAFASNSSHLFTSVTNLGNRQFSAPISIDLGFPPQAITHGDLTGNGIADILVSGWPPTILSFIDGSWQSTILDTGYLASEAEICDIDNDGDNDIVTYSIPPMGDDCNLRIYENQNGQFSLRFQHIYSFVSGLAVFDHNNDMLPDFLLGNRLVTNLGNFSFSDPVLLHSSAAGNRNAFADMDDNGYLDILSIVCDYQNNIGLLKISFNDGNGSFAPEPTTENSDEYYNASPQVQLNCYPNPFKTSVTISYTLPRAYEGGEISIYNLKGQLVKTLLNADQEAGNHSIIWNGTDTKGQSMASGVYLYRLSSPGQTFTKRMLLIK